MLVLLGFCIWTGIYILLLVISSREDISVDPVVPNICGRELEDQ